MFLYGVWESEYRWVDKNALVSFDCGCSVVARISPFFIRSNILRNKTHSGWHTDYKVRSLLSISLNSQMKVTKRIEPFIPTFRFCFIIIFKSTEIYITLYNLSKWYKLNDNPYFIRNVPWNLSIKRQFIIRNTISQIRPFYITRISTKPNPISNTWATPVILLFLPSFVLFAFLYLFLLPRNILRRRIVSNNVNHATQSSMDYLYASEITFHTTNSEHLNGNK